MNKKAIVSNLIIGLGILTAAIILSASYYTQRAAISERTLGEDQTALRLLGLEGQGALIYLDEAAQLAAIKAKKTFEQTGGLPIDPEGEAYPCGTILEANYWYNNKTCLPYFAQTLENKYRAALTSYLQTHPTINYPSFLYTLTPQQNQTSAKGKGINKLLFATSYDDNDLLYFQKTGFVPDFPSAISPTTLPYGSRGGKEIKKIVIHYSVTKDAQTAIRILQERGLSYHYIIDHDGTIYQLVPEEGSAWQAGCTKEEDHDHCVLPGMNQQTIGISFANCGHDEQCQKLRTTTCTERTGACWENYDQAQLEAFTNLMADIIRRNPSLGETATTETFLMHSDIKTTKKDPGPLFEEQLSTLIQTINTHLTTQQTSNPNSDLTENTPLPTTASTTEQMKILSEQFEAVQAELKTEQTLIGPSAWCTGTEAPTSNTYATRILKEAYNSNGQNYLQASIAAGIEYNIDPALLITHMIYESSMGQNNVCTAQGKTALTGCGWPNSCAKGCACTGDNVLSDVNQLRCTARTDKVAYEEALSGAAGKAAGQYEKCAEYNDDQNKMWTCMLCIYQGNYAEDVTGKNKPYFTKDGTCEYAENFKNTYCSWNAYIEATGAIKNYQVGEETTRASASYSLPISFATTIDVNLKKYEDIKDFANTTIQTCPDNNPTTCVQELLTTFNTEHQTYNLTTTCDNTAYVEAFMQQYTSCEERSDNTPCSIFVDVPITTSFFLKFTPEGILQSNGSSSRLVYKGTNYNYIQQTSQNYLPQSFTVGTPQSNIAEENISILFTKKNTANIYLNNNKDVILEEDRDLTKNPLVFTKEGDKLYLDLRQTKAMPAANTTFFICEEGYKETGKGLLFALDLEDPQPETVENMQSQYVESLNLFELSWEPVTTYSDGTPTKDILSYEIHCSAQALTGILDYTTLTTTITRKDGKNFPQEDYKDTTMSALLDKCAGKPLGTTPITITVLAKDSAGQYSIAYTTTLLTPTQGSPAPTTPYTPLSTSPNKAEEHIVPPPSIGSLPTTLLPEEANLFMPLLETYYPGIPSTQLLSTLSSSLPTTTP